MKQKLAILACALVSSSVGVNAIAAPQGNHPPKSFAQVKADMKDPTIPNAIKLEELKTIIDGISQSYQKTLDDLMTMNVYAVEAANGTVNDTDALLLDAQLQGLKADIENKAQYLLTIFGPERVNGATIEVKLDSNDPTNIITIKYPNIDIVALGIKDTKIATREDAENAIVQISDAIKKVTLALGT